MLKRAISAILPVVSIVGCASLDPRPAEDVVAERAQQRVDLLMAGKLEASYALTSPGYRATATPRQYQIAYGGVGMWQSAEVQDVQCQREPIERCKVLLGITYRTPRLGMENTTLLPETWILSDGKWYKFEE